MSEQHFKNIGAKVRYFRKLYGKSQLDLEVEIGASAGSLSRIENGEINPTKETIAKVALALKLNSSELLYLGSSYNSTTQQSTEEAINKVKTTFTSLKHFYYLLDDKYRIVYFSRALTLLAGMVGVNTQKLIGHNPEEIIFNPEFGFRRLIDQDKFDPIAISVLAPWTSERKFLFLEDWCKELFDRLKQFQDFNRLWEYVQNNKVEVYSEDSRVMYLNLLSKNIKTIYSFTHLLDDPRFIIIELKFIDLPKFLQPEYVVVKSSKAKN